VIEIINREILLSSHAEQDRGMIGVRDRGTLEFIEDRIRADGRDAHRGIRLAAWALYMLATSHAFWQANKRTAFIVAEMVLNHYGLGIHPPPDDVGVEFMLRVARGEYPVEAVSEWLRMRLEARPEENLCEVLERHRTLLERLSER
jgi:death-on-curing family protein